MGQGVRFVLGLGVGFLAVPLVGLSLIAVAGLATDGHTRHGFAMKTSGADVSRAGGSQVSVKTYGGPIRQRCNEACDDLTVTSNDMPYRIEILDGRDKRVKHRQVNFAHALGLQNS